MSEPTDDERARVRALIARLREHYGWAIPQQSFTTGSPHDTIRSPTAFGGTALCPLQLAPDSQTGNRAASQRQDCES